MSTSVSPIATPEERASCDAAIAAWVASSAAAGIGAGILAVDRDPDLARWYIRLKGDEKDVVTIWLTVRQRTLRHETHFMPAPETNVCDTYQYLLRRNSTLRGMRFCLGDEDAVYLVGELPVADVTEDEIDRIVGASLEYVDECFPAAMTLGYANLYRRRPRRR
jgi:hypothetical protein